MSIFRIARFCKLSDDIVTSSTEVLIYALLSEIPIPNNLYILCDD